MGRQGVGVGQRTSPVVVGEFVERVEPCCTDDPEIDPVSDSLDPRYITPQPNCGGVNNGIDSAVFQLREPINGIVYSLLFFSPLLGVVLLNFG